jgi:nucleotide-binding universal stress UspA family protein
MPTIVIGFDGSKGAETALRVGLHEARMRDADVRVVHAWPTPPYVAAGSWSAGPYALSGEGAVVAARQEELADLFRRVQAIQEEEGLRSVPIEVVGQEGSPADVLIDAAADADLLIVGSRGHGTLAALLLGSVSQACARRARCPLVVVPPEMGAFGSHREPAGSAA